MLTRYFFSVKQKQVIVIKLRLETSKDASDSIENYGFWRDSGEGEKSSNPKIYPEGLLKIHPEEIL